jgi:hypothetical protein
MVKMAVFWVLAPCNLKEVYRRFRGVCCLHHQGDESHETTRHDNPEVSHLHTHHCENLKSYLIVGDSFAVEMYLEFACCAAVPGGGRNKEYALHVLHMCHGNIHVSISAFHNPGDIIIVTTIKSIQYW